MENVILVIANVDFGRDFYALYMFMFFLGVVNPYSIFAGRCTFAAHRLKP